MILHKAIVCCTYIIPLRIQIGYSIAPEMEERARVIHFSKTRASTTSQHSNWSGRKLQITISNLSPSKAICPSFVAVADPFILLYPDIQQKHRNWFLAQCQFIVYYWQICAENNNINTSDPFPRPFQVSCLATSVAYSHNTEESVCPQIHFG